MSDCKKQKILDLEKLANMEIMATPRPWHKDVTLLLRSIDYEFIAALRNAAPELIKDAIESEELREKLEKERTSHNKTLEEFAKRSGELYKYQEKCEKLEKYIQNMESSKLMGSGGPGFCKCGEYEHCPVCDEQAARDRKAMEQSELEQSELKANESQEDWQARVFCNLSPDEIKKFWEDTKVGINLVERFVGPPKEYWRKKILRNLSSDEAREFWASAEKVAKQVDNWPDSRRAGINVDQPPSLKSGGQAHNGQYDRTFGICSQCGYPLDKMAIARMKNKMMDNLQCRKKKNIVWQSMDTYGANFLTAMWANI